MFLRLKWADMKCGQGLIVMPILKAHQTRWALGAGPRYLTAHQREENGIGDANT